MKINPNFNLVPKMKNVIMKLRMGSKNYSMNKSKVFGLVLVGAVVLFGAVALADTVYQPSALFDTQLNVAMDNVSTSTMTLQLGVDKSGNALNAFMCFTVDGGLSNVEYVCGSASGTVVSSLVRGIDFTDGVTASTSRYQKHRIGADVKQTDYPYLSQIQRLLGGTGTFPSPLNYAAGVTPAMLNSNPQSLASVQYVASTAFAGAPNATFLLQGLSQAATGSQIGAGTATGTTGALLFVPNQFLKTTATASSVVVSNGSSTIDKNWISSSTNYGFSNQTLSIQTATSSATSTDSFNLLPAGVVQMYATSSAPAGWLLCDGTSYSTSSYPRLFTVIGYTYGGSTSTFNVPNLAGRFPAGPSSSLSTTLGATGGATSTVAGPFTLQGATGVGDANPQVSGLSTNSQTLPTIPPYIILQFLIKY